MTPPRDDDDTRAAAPGPVDPPLHDGTAADRGDAERSDVRVADDVALMEAVAAGDAESFEELVRRHHGGVIRFFRRSLRDQALSEDFAQEVFLRLFRAAGRYRPQAKFTTFLYRIAKNYLIDHFRSRANQMRPLSLEGPGGHSVDGDEMRLGDMIAAATPGPIEPLQHAELGRALEEAIAQLPDDHRLVFTLAEVDGMRYQDIADTVQIPVGTVKSRMFASYRKLREMLAHLAPTSLPDPASDGPPASPRRRDTDRNTL